MFGKVLFAVVLARINSELIVDYSRNELGAKDKIPKAKPTLVVPSETAIGCAARCSLIQTCKSFYYKNDECGLFDFRETALKKAVGYSYFYLSATGGKNPAPKPQVCEYCPHRMPLQKEFTYVNNTRTSYILCGGGADDRMFKKAEEGCTCAGGRLVSISSPEVQTAVEQLVRKQLANGVKVAKKVWTGQKVTVKKPCTHERSDGQTITEDNSTSYYSNWGPKEPDCGKGKGVRINANPKDEDFGKWYDEDNLSDISYICEFVV